MRASRPSGETATSCGPVPTGSVAATLPEARSIRETAASALFATIRVAAWTWPATKSIPRARVRAMWFVILKTLASCNRRAGRVNFPRAPKDRRPHDHPVADLHHRCDGLCLRHLRAAHAAAHRPPGSPGAGGRHAGLARVPDVGGPAVLHPGLR